MKKSEPIPGLYAAGELAGGYPKVRTVLEEIRLRILSHSGRIAGKEIEVNKLMCIVQLDFFPFAARFFYHISSF